MIFLPASLTAISLEQGNLPRSMSAFPLPSMLTLPSILSANQSISYYVTNTSSSTFQFPIYRLNNNFFIKLTNFSLWFLSYKINFENTFKSLDGHLYFDIAKINFNDYQIQSMFILPGFWLEKESFWTNRLAGNQGCVDGLSGGVRGVGDVKPGREHAPEILCVRGALGISAFRRAGSGSGALAVGTRAARRRRRQTLPGRAQIRLLRVARLPVVLLHLHTLWHR